MPLMLGASSIYIAKKKWWRALIKWFPIATFLKP
jgi:hypothetical protein